jgi:hypothetical protein
MADLDKDGYLDIVSVHESDTEYDGVPDGYIRLAFGTADPDRWILATLASGKEAAAPEDVAVGDLNGDGYLDVIAACELAHLIYFQNPGANIRTATWPRVIPEVTNKRGSYIRAFFADLNGDGRPEVVSPNKGAQSPRRTQPPSAISWFEVKGDPLKSDSWIEHELTRVIWPINSQPVDIDGDGDLDILGGSVAETRMMLFENTGGKETASFKEHPINIAGTSLSGNDRPANRRNDTGALVSGFNTEFVDLSGDGRLDIVTFEFVAIVGRSVVWLEQPPTLDGTWQLHKIGIYSPDEVVGISVADINGDGRPDVMTGGYSGGARDADRDTSVGSLQDDLRGMRIPPTQKANGSATTSRADDAECSISSSLWISTATKTSISFRRAETALLTMACSGSNRFERLRQLGLSSRLERPKVRKSRCPPDAEPCESCCYSRSRRLSSTFR